MRFIDSFEGDISNQIMISSSGVNVYNLGLQEVNYNISNPRGYTFKKNVSIHVVDRIDPMIKSKDKAVITVLKNDNTYDPKDFITLSDNYNSVEYLLSSLEVVYDDLNINKNGTYKTEFQTTDERGNKSRVFTLYASAVVTAGTENESLKSSISLYPNPISITLFVESTIKDNNAEITVNDASGVNLSLETTKTAFGYQIDVSSLASGLYFIAVYSNGEMQRSSFVVQER